MPDILAYIKSKGWKYKPVDSDKGLEFKVEVCPFCHDIGGHFYLNSQTGFCYCHKCGNSGGIYTVMKALGDLANILEVGKQADEPKPTINIEEEMRKVVLAHDNLLHDEAVLYYLRKRRFSEAAMMKFVLGVSEENGIKWLWFPYIRNHKLYNIKKRALPPADKDFRRLYGGESILYNADVLDSDDFDYIIITEGESDCIALWSAGIPNVVGATVGAKGVKNEWIQSLDKFGKIYLAFDTDMAGKDGAARFAKRLGIERCYHLKLPPNYKDINKYFMSGRTLDEFKVLMDRAEKFDVDNVRSISGIIQDSISRLYLTGETNTVIHYPWESVERITGGLAPGDLIVVAGRPGVGKTTFALQLVNEFSTQGIPSLLYELEMRPERLMPRIVGYHLRKDSRLVGNYEDLQKAYAMLRDKPMYIAYQYKKVGMDTISDTIRMCVQRYGIQFLVFDNIHFLIRGDEDITRRIGATIQEFKLLAEELEIPIVAIARPRKSGAGAREMDSQDLAWSGDIEGDADMIVIVHRNKKKEVSKDYAGEEGIFDPMTDIIIDKCRYNVGGRAHLVADDALARFDEKRGLA